MQIKHFNKDVHQVLNKANINAIKNCLNDINKYSHQKKLRVKLIDIIFKYVNSLDENSDIMLYAVKQIESNIKEGEVLEV